MRQVARADHPQPLVEDERARQRHDEGERHLVEVGRDEDERDEDHRRQEAEPHLALEHEPLTHRADLRADTCRRRGGSVSGIWIGPNVHGCAIAAATAPKRRCRVA